MVDHRWRKQGLERFGKALLDDFMVEALDDVFVLFCAHDIFFSIPKLAEGGCAG